MNYCTLLITKKLPTDDEIKEIMKPFDEEDFYSGQDESSKPYPTFLCDYYQIGGRFRGIIKLRADDNKKYEWKYYAKKPRNRRLFISGLLDQVNDWVFMSEEEFLPYFGVRDGHIYVDGAWIEDIINLDEIQSFNLLLPDGSSYTREYYDGEKIIDQTGYDEKVKKAFDDYRNCFLTILDVHS